ncbi:hypothetical protein BN1723_008575 [Verticillium longisporum]|uniref:NAD-dependent epimerase/dehydratase domain-containing protein n=1 Tax=Verticillium longisporum TaxID=100787 RepID=A0A0G4KGL6_VERLO|nr:hypothetical protein BN1723_008575 [Verticillium longisporum]
MVKVLLTGGSGFIGGHVLEQLIEQGHDAVVTVRSEDKAQKIRDDHKDLAAGRLTVAIVPDIAREDAFDEVVKTPGLEAVLHTASPFHFNFTDPKKDLIDPAVIGTTAILQALHRSAPGVKRVVITSSFASIIDEARVTDPTKIFTERDWNPVTEADMTQSKATAYRASKKLAERAAWDFVAAAAPAPTFDLVTICPPLVLGPVGAHLASLDAINTSNERLRDWNPVTEADITQSKATAYRASKKLAERAAWDFVDAATPAFDLVTICPPLVLGPVGAHLASLDAINTSNERLVQLLRGAWKTRVADTGAAVLWVDVRDCAAAHLRALEAPAAAGRRLFTTAGWFSNREIAAVVRENFPELADRLPGPEVEGGEFPPKDKVYGYDNTATNEILGIQWIGLEKSIVDSTPAAGGRRLFTTAGWFSNREIATVVRENFPELVDRLPGPEVEGGEFPPKDKVYGYDNTATNEILGIQWIGLEKSIVDSVKQLQSLPVWKTL